LSDDAIEHYIGRYQTMLAARQQDPAQLAEAYRDIESLVLYVAFNVMWRPVISHPSHT
jgi:hypothetical protein